eukprot:SAG22_NODE_724_length_7634_cov_11.669808_9_plen_507_part_00
MAYSCMPSSGASARGAVRARTRATATTMWAWLTGGDGSGAAAPPRPPSSGSNSSDDDDDAALFAAPLTDVSDHQTAIDREAWLFDEFNPARQPGGPGGSGVAGRRRRQKLARRVASLEAELDRRESAGEVDAALAPLAEEWAALSRLVQHYQSQSCAGVDSDGASGDATGSSDGDSDDDGSLTPWEAGLLYEIGEESARDQASGPQQPARAPPEARAEPEDRRSSGDDDRGGAGSDSSEASSTDWAETSWAAASSSLLASADGVGHSTLRFIEDELEVSQHAVGAADVAGAGRLSAAMQPAGPGGPAVPAGVRRLELQDDGSSYEGDKDHYHRLHRNSHSSTDGDYRGNVDSTTFLSDDEDDEAEQAVPPSLWESLGRWDTSSDDRSASRTRPRHRVAVAPPISEWQREQQRHQEKQRKEQEQERRLARGLLLHGSPDADRPTSGGSSTTTWRRGDLWRASTAGDAKRVSALLLAGAIRPYLETIPFQSLRGCLQLLLRSSLRREE